MKYVIIALTALLSIVSISSHANSVKIAPVVLSSFEKSFEKATEVKWTAAQNLYKAEFNFNGQYIAAFFDGKGNIIATTKNIASYELPLSLQMGLRKEYEKFWISELFEVSDNDGTNYYITLENAETKIVLKSSGSQSWNQYLKHNKS